MQPVPPRARAKRGPLLLRRALLGLIPILAAIFVASSLLFVWPAADRPQHVDAVVSLNGRDEQAREKLAISLVEKGYAHVLIFSQGNARTTACPVVPKVEVVCFEPRPARTVGEVEFAARYAHRNHWTSLIIVPGRAQATRARLLMRRCYSGRVVVVPAQMSFWEIPQAVVYEWGALAKAIVLDRRC